MAASVRREIPQGRGIARPGVVDPPGLSAAETEAQVPLPTLEERAGWRALARAGFFLMSKNEMRDSICLLCRFRPV